MDQCTLLPTAAADRLTRTTNWFRARVRRKGGRRRRSRHRKREHAREGRKEGRARSSRQRPAAAARGTTCCGMAPRKRASEQASERGRSRVERKSGVCSFFRSPSYYRQTSSVPASLSLSLPPSFVLTLDAARQSKVQRHERALPSAIRHPSIQPFRSSAPRTAARFPTRATRNRVVERGGEGTRCTNTNLDVSRFSGGGCERERRPVRPCSDRHRLWQPLRYLLKSRSGTDG